MTKFIEKSLIDQNKEENDFYEISLIDIISSLVRNKKIISGHPEKIKKIYDTWVFSRDTRSNNPNWQLIDTLT